MKNAICYWLRLWRNAYTVLEWTPNAAEEKVTKLAT
jgi:hypothetical protein